MSESIPRVVVNLVLALLVIWGETGGLVHAFRQHGVGDGWAAVYVPPLAWWRGIEFFFHRPTSVPQSAQDWPPLNSQELDTISRVSGKAMREPLSESDLSDLRSTIKNYTLRTGRPLTPDQVNLFAQFTELPYKYSYELGRCLLASIDGKSPFISKELQLLRAQMEKSFTRKEKLDSDFRMIVSTGNGTSYSDEFGQARRPLSRQQVLDGLERTESVKANFERLIKVYRELQSKP